MTLRIGTRTRRPSVPGPSALRRPAAEPSASVPRRPPLGRLLAVPLAGVAVAAVAVVPPTSGVSAPGVTAPGVTAAAVAAVQPAAVPAAATTPGTRGMPPDAVRLSAVAPTVLQEIRYAGDHNFLGRRVDGYGAAQCWLTRKAAAALARAQVRVARKGYTLKVYDCFRPQRAVDDFVAWAADPDATAAKAEFYPRVAKTALLPGGYIAARSSHSRGSTVDVTLVPAGRGVSPAWTATTPLVDCAAPAATRFPDTSVDMGTGYDCFDPRAHLASTAITEAQKARRAVLLVAMTAEGFNSYAPEWWHYTLADEPHPTTYYDAVVVR